MRNTLYDGEFSDAIKAIEELLHDIYCREDAKHEIDCPEAKDFLYAVLDAIDISY